MINNTWNLAPWAAALYSCDLRWWESAEPGYGREAFLQFDGLKFIGKGECAGCIPCGVEGNWQPMDWTGERLGAGGNSGFQAVNLAAVCGAARIILTGFDMSDDDGVHWHGPHRSLNNPKAKTLQSFARALDGAAPEMEARGITVVNASRKSALAAYPRVTMAEALA